jgi:hypothetical protein
MASEQKPPVKDFYAHRKNKPVEEQLRKKYEHLGDDSDMKSLDAHKLNKREFSEKLENDEEFRATYLKEQDEVRQKKLTDLIASLNNQKNVESAPAVATIPDDDDLIAAPRASEGSDHKNIINIQHVDKIEITFNILAQ